MKRRPTGARGSSATSRKRTTRDAAAQAGTDPRLYVMNARDSSPGGNYVLYWCRAYRRATDNLALDHAVRRANELGVPLLVYEGLDVRYPLANDRLHRFVLEGACEMGEALAARGIGYAFYLPRTAREARESRSVERLAANACCVVTDWYPDVGGARSLWARTSRLAEKLPCRLEAYDDAVVVPMSLLGARESAARTIRPKVHAHLDASMFTSSDPSPHHAMRALPPLPFEPTRLDPKRLDAMIAACEIDHTVTCVTETRGGPSQGKARLERFALRALRNYATERNDLARAGSSGLSPYLHFGHLSARFVALRVRAEDAAGEGRDEFLEQLIVRRSLAFNHVMNEPRHATYESVPSWAREQLSTRRGDARPLAVDHGQWIRGDTRDVLWNAAQWELLRDGLIHPYARMLWGKISITLTKDPADAFAWLCEANDRFALDGRDPASYANIAWCFGLHDRPFPPRPIFGSVRSMTSKSAMQKWNVSNYFARVGMPAEHVSTGADEFDQRTGWDDVD